MWTFLPIGVFLLGFATTGDVQTLDREINKIYSELSALRKENSSLENKISALSDENQKLRTELFFRLENLQSEVRILSTGVEEYKDYLKRPSKEIGRVKEDVEGSLKVLEEKRKSLEEKNRAQEEKIKEMEDRLKGVEKKIKQAELEKSSPAKEVLPEAKRLSVGMGDLYKDAYETYQRGYLKVPERNLRHFSNSTPTPNFLAMSSFGLEKPIIKKKILRRPSWNMKK